MVVHVISTTIAQPQQWVFSNFFRPHRQTFSLHRHPPRLRCHIAVRTESSIVEPSREAQTSRYILRFLFLYRRITNVSHPTSLAIDISLRIKLHPHKMWSEPRGNSVKALMEKREAARKRTLQCLVRKVTRALWMSPCKSESKKLRERKLSTGIRNSISLLFRPNKKSQSSLEVEVDDSSSRTTEENTAGDANHTAGNDNPGAEVELDVSGAQQAIVSSNDSDQEQLTGRSPVSCRTIVFPPTTGLPGSPFGAEPRSVLPPLFRDQRLLQRAAEIRSAGVTNERTAESGEVDLRSGWGNRGIRKL
jgi:hypothetical protein